MATVFCKRKMTLINKLYQRKVPRRKNMTANALREKPGEDSPPYGTIALNLGNIIINFENGQWIPQLSPWDETNRENVFLKRQISQLAETSNLLKLKNDVLLDMSGCRVGQSELGGQEVLLLQSNRPYMYRGKNLHMSSTRGGDSCWLAKRSMI